MVPHTPVWKFALGLGVVLIGAAIGISLAHYAEIDDAPGGVVIGVLVLVGAVALGIRIVNQRPESSVRR